jgi:hypothetical protein
MITDAWKNVWKAATEARRWMMVANALDIISEAYEKHTAIPVTAIMTVEGIFIEIQLDELNVSELLEPDDIAEISPQAYALLRRAGAIPATTISYN